MKDMRFYLRVEWLKKEGKTWFGLKSRHRGTQFLLPFTPSLPFLTRKLCFFPLPLLPLSLVTLAFFSKPKTSQNQWARRQSGFAAFSVSKKQTIAPHPPSHPKRNADGASLNQTQKRTTTLLPPVHHKETTAVSTPWQSQQPLLQWRKRPWLPPKLPPLLSD